MYFYDTGSITLHGYNCRRYGTKTYPKESSRILFFLAVPTMFAATVYKMAKLFMDGGTEIISTNLTTLIVGNVVAFIVALLAIKFFISFVTKYGFVAFGWYRIIVGSIILIMSF